MKLTINEKCGESQTEYVIDGDYEEVLAIITELGFCNDTLQTTINNCIQQVILQESKPGGLLS